MAQFIDWMPVQGSEYAAKVDWTNNLITGISLFFIAAITAVMLFFAFHYRRSKRGDKTEYITHNVLLEVTWTVVPVVIILMVSYFGTLYYMETRTVPLNPIEITVEGYKWGWDFTYPTGKKSASELVVPINRPVRLLIKSRDVVHSLFIPAMRLKEDLVANNYHYLTFTPNRIGSYPIFCAEYCGVGHSFMRATLRVVPGEEYADYVSGTQAVDLPPLERGKQVFEARACVSCHTTDGTPRVGPSLKGVFGRESAFTDGTKAAADENYLRESILEPNKKISAGYPPAMPSFAGQLSEDELSGLIAYLKSLK